ncbi:MAG: monovalent cation/H(+) antiporter subunit G [Opitutales bacterium]
MIEVIASVPVPESANSPGWFLVHSIGMGMGILGLVFFLGTAVGMVRFPDFYTRMHAAGKGDTLSTMLMLTGFGLVIMEDFSITSWLLLVKILGIVLFIFLTTPTSSHALMRAAFEDDEMPLGEKDLKKLRRRSNTSSEK